MERLAKRNCFAISIIPNCFNVPPAPTNTTVTSPYRQRAQSAEPAQLRSSPPKLFYRSAI